MTASMPGLLDGLAQPPAPKAARRALRLEWHEFIRRRWSNFRRNLEQDPKFRKRARAIGFCVLALAVAGGGVGAYFAFRERPTPDYLKAEIDDILDYTILSDEFNKLPIKKRLELLGQLVDRLKKLDSGDSELLAAFAAGIKGEVRRHLEENISRLAIDAWDEKALAYKDVKPQDRSKYLEDAYVDFEKMMEAVGGRVRDISDEERLARAKKNGKREYEGFKSGQTRPANTEIGKFVGFMNTRVASHAGPAQRERGAAMMRDMTRVFRGQDVATGKPIEGK